VLDRAVHLDARFDADGSTPVMMIVDLKPVGSADRRRS
jgi:hypothetical protein